MWTPSPKKDNTCWVEIHTINADSTTCKKLRLKATLWLVLCWNRSGRSCHYSKVAAITIFWCFIISLKICFKSYNNYCKVKYIVPNSKYLSCFSLILRFVNRRWGAGYLRKCEWGLKSLTTLRWVLGTRNLFYLLLVTLRLSVGYKSHCKSANFALRKGVFTMQHLLSCKGTFTMQKSMLKRRTKT